MTGQQIFNDLEFYKVFSSLKVKNTANVPEYQSLAHRA